MKYLKTFNLTIFTIFLITIASTSSCTKAISGDTIVNTQELITDTANARSKITKQNARTMSVQLSIKDFGAKGDGVTDDYQAFLAAADYANKNKTINLFFPSGTYYIKSYHSKSNNLEDIKFVNCNGITITGEPGSVIKLNGRFLRAKDLFHSGFWYSSNNTIQPFWFENCQNVNIQDLEIYGGVNKMTKAVGLATEGAGFAIRMHACTGVLIQNIYAHHMQTDGILISNRYQTPCRNITLKNVVSTNNGRQGMSIGGLINGQFLNCSFNYSGITEGSYAGQSPQAGVDIEPNIPSSNILFQNCTFAESYGAQVIVQNTSNVTLKNCTVEVSDLAGATRLAIIMSAMNGVIDGCDMDLKHGSIFPAYQHPSSTTIINNTIKSYGSGIIADSKYLSDKVVIQGNHLIYSQSKMGKTYFPYLGMNNLSFLNNDVFIPATAVKSRKGAHGLISNALISSGNNIHSENSAVKPIMGYPGTKKVND